MEQESKQKGKFLRTFIKERKQVGALAPSSRFLVKKMCDKIDFNSAKTIVEFGPGTGVFTEELLKRANPDCKIFVIELNSEFHSFLKNKFKDERIILLRESADNIDKILQDHKIGSADAILSSLPLAVIPEQIKKRIIIKAFDVLRKGGVYVQYQYSLNAKKLLELKFGSIHLNFVPINIPPAFVYTGIKS